MGHAQKLGSLILAAAWSCPPRGLALSISVAEELVDRVIRAVQRSAQGRTNILKINYRKTRQILHTASLMAADLLTADNKDDDGIPLLKPGSCGREGQEPLIIQLPTLQAEAEAIADHLAQAHQEGFAWGDRAVLCADTKTRDLCARTVAQRELLVENRISLGHFDPTSNKIKAMTMKVSKGLEFPVVALPGVGTCLRRGMRRRRRGCFMWRQLGRASGW